MQKAKVDILVAQYCYGGNGGIKSIAAQICPWWAKTYAGMINDDRIGRVDYITPGDIPLDMERNRVVAFAMKEKYDMIFMLDSDNIPDLHLPQGEPNKPFWETSFNFAYDRIIVDKPTVVCAPYCGPPPHPVNGGMENVYVFYWEGLATEPLPQHILAMYSREHALQLRGIQPIGAGPTGCILYTTSAFELLDVQRVSENDILDMLQQQQITIETAKRMLRSQSWFYYEFEDLRRTSKASTEDVTNLRDISLAGYHSLSEDVVFCNWDAWAGHAKPKIVGKPTAIRVEDINEHYRRAVEKGLSNQEVLIDCSHFDSGDKDVQQPTNGDGKPEVVARTICGVPVRSVVHQTKEDELQELANIVGIKANEKQDKELKVIEIGSWVGESAIAMTTGFGPTGGQVFCIDPMTGSSDDNTGYWSLISGGPDTLLHYFKSNVGDRLDDTIKLIQSDSLSVASGLNQPAEADIIFIDGEHTYEACKADIEAWLPHLAKDGWIMGHDYSDVFPGVKQAVDEAFSADGIDIRIAGPTQNIWIVSNEDIEAAKAPKKKRVRKAAENARS